MPLWFALDFALEQLGVNGVADFNMLLQSTVIWSILIGHAALIEPQVDLGSDTEMERLLFVFPGPLEKNIFSFS